MGGAKVAEFSYDTGNMAADSLSVTLARSAEVNLPTTLHFR
jgi:hypothetical protein